jgi:hypothetical protein
VNLILENKIRLSGGRAKPMCCRNAPSCLVLMFLLSFSEFFYSIKTSQEVKQLAQLLATNLRTPALSYKIGIF